MGAEIIERIRFYTFFKTNCGECYTIPLRLKPTSWLMKKSVGRTFLGYYDPNQDEIVIASGDDCDVIPNSMKDIGASGTEFGTIEKTQRYVFSHEILHYVLNHVPRMKAIKNVVWDLANIAADHVVDGMLAEVFDVKESRGYFLGSHYAKGPLEKVYQQLLAEYPVANITISMPVDGAPGDGQGASDTDMQPKIMVEGDHLTEEQKQQIEDWVRKTMSYSAQPTTAEASKMKNTCSAVEQLKQKAMAANARGSGSSDFLIEFDAARGIAFDWKKYLKGYSEQVFAGFDDISLFDPDMVADQYGLEDLYIPDDVAYRPKKVGVIMDSSGSIGDEERSIFTGVLNDGFKKYKISARYICVDDCIKYDETVTSIEQVQIIGGGGTDLRPAFELLEKDRDVEVVFCFTDGYTPWPEKFNKRALIVMCDNNSTDNVPQWGKIIRI